MEELGEYLQNHPCVVKVEGIDDGTGGGFGAGGFPGFQMWANQRNHMVQQFAAAQENGGFMSFEMPNE